MQERNLGFFLLVKPKEKSNDLRLLPILSVDCWIELQSEQCNKNQRERERVREKLVRLDKCNQRSELEVCGLTFQRKELDLNHFLLFGSAVLWCGCNAFLLLTFPVLTLQVRWLFHVLTDPNPKSRQPLGDTPRTNLLKSPALRNTTEWVMFATGVFFSTIILIYLNTFLPYRYMQLILTAFIFSNTWSCLWSQFIRFPLLVEVLCFYY